MLIARFHDKLAEAMSDGLVWVGPNQLTNATVDQWRKDMSQYSKFAIEFQKAKAA